jgi:hypothetical protein
MVPWNRLCPADQIASLLRNMCQGYEEDRGAYFPGLVLMQRLVRRFPAKRKQEITVTALDSLEQAATRIQRTVRCYLFRAHIGRRPPTSIAAPVLSDPLNSASQADTAPPKPVTVDWTQEVPAETDDAASAASTTRDITSLLLGLLFGPWSTRRRRTWRRTGSLYRHTQTAPTCNLEHLVSSDTAPLLPWPRSRLTRHSYRLSSISHRRPRLSINHGCTDGTGPRPSFEPK